MKDLVSFIWKFIKLQKWAFCLILLFSFAWPLESTVMPYILRKIIDALGANDLDRAAAWPILRGLLAFGAGVWIVVELSFRTKNFLQARAFPKLEADIRMNMFDHIQHHSPRYFNEHFSGSLANKITDMTTQVTLLITSVTVFFPTIVTCAISIGLFYQVNPLFALILGIWVFIHMSICFPFAKKGSEYSNIHGEARTALVGKIVDSLSNNFAVNLFHQFAFEKDRLAPAQKEERDKNTRTQWCIAWMFTSLSTLFIVAGFTLNGFLIFYWLRGKITTGEIIQVFNTTWNVIFALWMSGEMLPQFFQSLGIARQALSVMNHPQDVLDMLGATPLIVKRGEIIFENVSFQYGMKNLFENKNVHIKAGERVGLVGYSGAGKSTFVNLILRFFPLKKGKILIDGQNIAEAKLDSLRKQVSLIPQEALLFHRSLEENIAYSRPTASKEEIVEAAKLAHSDEFIQKCQNGYNSLVGDRGTKLSGGERQRIAIARAILKDSPILILDEATSALDSVTERYIQDSLDKLMQNRTTLVIAHRLSTLSKMNRILVFDQGKIVEEGSHEELMSQKGHYAHMWQMQAGGFLPDSPSSV